MTINENTIIKKPHFHAYRVAARLKESIEYIQKVRLEESQTEISNRAIREAWFGSKSKDMTRRIVAYMYARYSIYKTGLRILKNSIEDLEAYDFRMISHFHLQLADPYYRWLTGVYFPKRKQDGFTNVTPDVLIPEFAKVVESDLKPVSIRTYCSKVLTTAKDVGLLKGKTKKEFDSPILSEKALLYIFIVWQSMSLPLSDFLEFEFFKSFLDLDSFSRILDKGHIQGFWQYQILDQYFSCSINQKKASEIFRTDL